MSIAAVVWLVKQLLLGTLRDTGNNIPRKSRSVFFFFQPCEFSLDSPSVEKWLFAFILVMGHCLFMKLST